MTTKAKQILERVKREAVARSLEDQLAMHLMVMHLDEGCIRQYPAILGRGYLWDFAWPEARLLVEIHGGTFVGGAHSRGARQRKDFEKQNAAVMAGWRVLTFDTTMVRDGTAIMTVENVLRETPTRS